MLILLPREHSRAESARRAWISVQKGIVPRHGYHYGEVTYVRVPRTYGSVRDTAEETSRRAVQGHNSLPAGSLYLNLIVARAAPRSLSLPLSLPPSLFLSLRALRARTREGAHSVKRTVDSVCANAEGYKGGPLYARSTYITISGMYHPRGPEVGHVILATRWSLRIQWELLCNSAI